MRKALKPASCLLRAHAQHLLQAGGKHDQHTGFHQGTAEGEERGQLKAGLHTVSQGKWVVPHAAHGGFRRCQLERLSSPQPVHEEPKQPPELEKFDNSRLKYGHFQTWP